MKCFAAVCSVGLFAALVAGSAFADDQRTLDATVVTKDVSAANDAKSTSVAGFSSTVCTQGKNKRMVELSFGNPQTKLPCEVHYKKETEQPGHDQVIFHAANAVSFCESKAAAFADKLAGMGWTCAKQ